MDLTPTDSSASRALAIQQLIPDEGLFAGQEWRISSDPFPLPVAIYKEIEFLGRVLLKFYQSVNLLYRQSRSDRQPNWIAQLLDQGKPDELLNLQNLPELKNDLPRVIRPDLLLTDDGFVISELDSVPGGIGLTAWLNKAYSELGETVVGGADGMLSGFAGIFGRSPNVHLMVSEESASYRPEMVWLSQQLGTDRFQVRSESFGDFQDDDAVYRFFELFDLPNIPAAPALFRAVAEQRISMTPPPKPIFEEKLLFGLLHNRNLSEFWRQQLGQGFLRRLLPRIPYTWIVDPEPLPPQAAFPEIHLTNWHQLKSLSQKERNLILKISGYSEKAWGARSVQLGSDLPQDEWSRAVEEAIQDFPTSPWILQKFHKPKSVHYHWFDFESATTQAMQGRVRLCPYYFVHGEPDQARAHLGGILATVCPADKKIIHGMSEAVLAPCKVVEA